MNPFLYRRIDTLYKLVLILLAAAIFLGCQTPQKTILIDRSEYKDKLRGFWLGSCIANWTGLKTELIRNEKPFFTDADWQTNQGRGNELINFVLDQDPWKSDDDTDIEYVYQAAIEKYGTHFLTPEQIRDTWNTHIGKPYLWVSNLAASGQMLDGAVPPSTSLPINNPMWEMIDAQLTTEIFGALAPSRPDVALAMAHLPIRTTAYTHSEWAAEFYVIMYSLTATVDKTLTHKEQVFWLAAQARKRIPEWSYIAKMYDFVKKEYEINPDKDNWEHTRDAIYERYQIARKDGYDRYSLVDSGINFASSLVSLFYGEGDFKKTIRIGTLSGWDSDNPTATWGGLLGLLYGHKELEKIFDKVDFSDAYRIERTRPDLARPTDSISDMAERALTIIDSIVIQSMDGSILDNHWVIPQPNNMIKKSTIAKPKTTWYAVDDADSRWKFDGFETRGIHYQNSLGNLAYGFESCQADISFSGTAVAFYADKRIDAGYIFISLDGGSPTRISQKSSYPAGQNFMLQYKRLNLKDTIHTLTIICDNTPLTKTIDMIAFIPGDFPQPKTTYPRNK
ncbi:MAG: ADP-ribosylglycohydrolase family protein [Colwellia sp.]|nr:ADP-ribosylglycohydrolase family protein [Colwellia sp.]